MKKILNIVCVDDEKIVLDSLNSQLSRNFGSNFNYEFAESAEEALEIIDQLRSEDPELIYVVISDWLMPGMKGDELLVEIRNKLNNVKTILLTGHADSKIIAEIINSKKDIKVIFKPWMESDLIDLINN
ncbi:MAG: response regulator [Saprospiraceae bacterium]|nr:response regulator [Saprospiraceae bacterium]HMW38986.1 response regulator [Saprospiraceae bacterium]HMX87752.1 response regulator [Saprospiraceae bacterium]HMZ39328.1 response regulator [Saprospiraceae bacterium]HNA63644.1 response regulator [Saprospiraceae bacterium]